MKRIDKSKSDLTSYIYDIKFRPWCSDTDSLDSILDGFEYDDLFRAEGEVARIKGFNGSYSDLQTIRDLLSSSNDYDEYKLTIYFEIPNQQ